MTLVIGIKPSKLPPMKRLLPFLFVLLTSAAVAESGAYRVEVIVFRNLDIQAEGTLAEELQSFSCFPSLVDPRLPETVSEAALEDLVPPRRYDLPDDLTVINEKSAYVDDAWKRLRASKGYRPLLYAAWEQNRTDYYPPLRIHNQQVIDTQLRPPTNIMVADLAAEDPLAAYRSDFYQLDGTVQLRRSRFLHLFIDLEIREPATTESPTGLDRFNSTGQQDDLDSEPPGTQRSVFKLKQNRQIRTERMQYFDSPYFGALVFVSPIAAKQELTPE